MQPIICMYTRQHKRRSYELMAYMYMVQVMTLYIHNCRMPNVAMKVRWEKTHELGRYRVNSLVRIRARDVRSHPMNTTEQIPVWSSVKGKYTPWIAYRFD